MKRKRTHPGASQPQKRRVRSRSGIVHASAHVNIKRQPTSATAAPAKDSSSDSSDGEDSQADDSSLSDSTEPAPFPDEGSSWESSSKEQGSSSEEEPASSARTLTQNAINSRRTASGPTLRTANDSEDESSPTSSASNSDSDSSSQSESGDNDGHDMAPFDSIPNDKPRPDSEIPWTKCMISKPRPPVPQVGQKLQAAQPSSPRDGAERLQLSKWDHASPHLHRDLFFVDSCGDPELAHRSLSQIWQRGDGPEGLAPSPAPSFLTTRTRYLPWEHQRPSEPRFPQPKRTEARPAGERMTAQKLPFPYSDPSAYVDGKRPGLPFPLSPSRIIRPHDRVRARGQDPISDTKEPKLSGKTTYVADQTKLPYGKKAKYYGVRQGRLPGIYYSWSDAKKQTEGCQCIFASFKIATDVEKYMNHAPGDCTYPSCSTSCSAAAESAQDTQGSIELQEQTECDCCGCPLRRSMTICKDCLWHPTAYLDRVSEREGLVPEQKSVLAAVARGENIFFTGAAGTGKSKLVHAIKTYLRGLGASVHIIAPTGIAAVNVEGWTMHSYASWDGNVSRVTLTDLCERAHQKKTWKRLTETDVLIIDEISMIENNSLTRLSQMLQAATSTSKRGDERQPFGGIQVVISGDFFQLAPVKPFDHCIDCGQRMEKIAGGLRRCEEHGDFELDEKFAFASPVWKACNFTMIELKHIHRQSEPALISILSTLRRGRQLTAEEGHVLQSHSVDVKRDEATKLKPTKEGASLINDYHIRMLPAEPLEYHAHDHFSWQQTLHPELGDLCTRSENFHGPLLALKGHLYQFDLELKHGMLVLLVANIDRNKGLVNGTIGTIVGFVEMKDDNMPRAYTKSRAKDREKFAGQIIYGDHRHYQVQQIRNFRDRLPETSRKWPVVQFKNGVKQVIFACCTITELGRCKPYSLLSRAQIPLLPGYAITIHKSQGMTLDRVVVDLDKCWEPGQAYVALSRARSLSGLIVETLPSSITADPIVEQFMLETFGEEEDDGELETAGEAA